MSSLTVRRVSREDIQLVQNLIERCLQLYMNRKEVMDTLLEQAKIEPGFTELVWEKLEEENRDFFKAYYLRLMLKHQIMEYNKLLEQQVNHMRQMHPTGGATTVQNRNGSHVPSMNQQQLCYEHKDSDQSSPNMSSAYLNGNSALNTNILSSVGFSNHSRRVDPPPNMLSLQTTNMHTINRPMTQGMIKSETAYSNCAPYMYGAEAHPTAGHTSIDPLVDADAASTFGFLGQIPRNFSLSDLTADFPQGSEILESYDGSPFLLADAQNFLDSS